MSSNKAGISLCASARVPGPGKLAVGTGRALTACGAEPWQPQGHGVGGSSCQRLQWMLLGAQGSRNLGQNRVCFPSPAFCPQLSCGLLFHVSVGWLTVRMLLLSRGICGEEATGPVSPLEPPRGLASPFWCCLWDWAPQGDTPRARLQERQAQHSPGAPRASCQGWGEGGAEPPQVHSSRLGSGWSGVETVPGPLEVQSSLPVDPADPTGLGFNLCAALLPTGTASSGAESVMGAQPRASHWEFGCKSPLEEMAVIQQYWLGLFLAARCPWPAWPACAAVRESPATPFQALEAGRWEELPRAQLPGAATPSGSGRLGASPVSQGRTGIPSGWGRGVPWRGQEQSLSPGLGAVGKGLAGGQVWAVVPGPASHQHPACSGMEQLEQLLLRHLQVPWQ